MLTAAATLVSLLIPLTQTSHAATAAATLILCIDVGVHAALGCCMCALTPLASSTKMRSLCCHSNRDGLGSNSAVARQQARSTDADATAAAASAILSSL